MPHFIYPHIIINLQDIVSLRLQIRIYYIYIYARHTFLTFIHSIEMSEKTQKSGFLPPCFLVIQNTTFKGTTEDQSQFHPLSPIDVHAVLNPVHE